MKFFLGIPRKMTRSSWRGYLGLCDERRKGADLHRADRKPPGPQDLPRRAPKPGEHLGCAAVPFHDLAAEGQGTTASGSRPRRPTSRPGEWIKHTVALADKYEKHRTGKRRGLRQVPPARVRLTSDTEFPSPDEQTLAELRDKREGR